MYRQREITRYLDLNLYTSPVKLDNIVLKVENLNNNVNANLVLYTAACVHGVVHNHGNDDSLFVFVLYWNYRTL